MGIKAGPAGVILGCLWRDDRLCAFAHSNYPLFPLTHQITAEKHYAIGLNTYQYRVRDRTMPPLQAQVVFLPDQNGDRRSDLSDYRLWLNRRLPDTDSLYIDLSSKPSVESREITEGIVLDYDADGEPGRYRH
jgi:hypothetical protein